MKRITFITLSLSIAACSSSGAMSPATSADYEDTAQTIAASTVVGGGASSGGIDGGDVLVLRDAVSLAKGKLPIGFLSSGGGRCHGKHGGVDQDFTVVCKDAAGAVLAKCDDTTDSATVTLASTGSLMTNHLTASVDRQGSWTITGLQSATATFAGMSSFKLDTTLTSVFHEGVTRTLSFENSAAYNAITIALKDRDGSGNLRGHSLGDVTGGSASFDVKAHRTVTGTDMGANDVDKSFEVHADLTFNGDGTATLVLDGTETFTIDLETGKVSKPPAA